VKDRTTGLGWHQEMEKMNIQQGIINVQVAVALIGVPYARSDCLSGNREKMKN